MRSDDLDEFLRVVGCEKGRYEIVDEIERRGYGIESEGFVEGRKGGIVGQHGQRMS